MRTRWAVGVLGAWLLGSSMMFVVAPTNFRLIDELLAGSNNAAFHALVERLGPGEARELLRYLASELNRTFFLRWNIAQAVLGGLALVLLPRRGADRWPWRLALVATGLAAGLLAVQPIITSWGRSLDFVPRNPPPPELARFQVLHVGYTVLELFKVACVGVALYRFARGERAASGLRPASAAQEQRA